MNVTIRPLEESDAHIAYKWRNDREVFKYTNAHYGHIITEIDERNWINKVIQREDEVRCAILANDVYVGNIYLTNIDTISAEYHIFIGNKKYWGKGVAKEASILLLNEAFNKLNLSFVTLHVHPENTAAIKLYEKLGFKRFVKRKKEFDEMFPMRLFRDDYSFSK